MDLATIVDALRASGLYPAAKGERIHVYGDTAAMPPELRDALRAARAGILEYLRAPAQAITYDVVHEASEAGWHPTVAGERLAWHRDGLTADTPPLTPALVAALECHRREVIQVLLDVPAGCLDRQTCEAAGICAGEIWESACTARKGTDDADD